jgi:hypothetical protein
MDGTATAGESTPQIALNQVSVERHRVMECWSIGWRITNRGAERLSVVAARLPHGQFKSEEIRFEPPLELSPDESAQFQTSVRCHETSGLVTENAFVIFHAIWLREPWRIFARVSVVVDAGGKPAAATESVTTQKVGFSGISA